MSEVQKALWASEKFIDFKDEGVGGLELLKNATLEECSFRKCENSGKVHRTLNYFPELQIVSLHINFVFRIEVLVQLVQILNIRSPSFSKAAKNQKKLPEL